MPKTSKIAISLPEEVLNAAEKQRKETGESRSEFFRRAIEMLMRELKEKDKVEQYIQAYEQIPETKEEINAAYNAASTILAEELWE